MGTTMPERLAKRRIARPATVSSGHAAAVRTDLSVILGLDVDLVLGDPTEAGDPLVEAARLDALADVLADDPELVGRAAARLAVLVDELDQDDPVSALDGLDGDALDDVLFGGCAA